MCSLRKSLMLARKIPRAISAILCLAPSEPWRSSVFLFLALLFVLPSPARATTYTWDSDANAANGATDGSGTWNLSGLNWFNSGTDIAWPNNTTDIAAFGRGGGGAGGRVTLGTSLSAGQISFTGGD